MKKLYVIVGHTDEATAPDRIGWLVSAHTKRAEAHQKCQMLNTVSTAAHEWHEALWHGALDAYTSVKAMGAALKGACGYKWRIDDPLSLHTYFRVKIIDMPKQTALVASHPAWADIIEAMPALSEVFMQAVAQEAAQMALEPIPPAPPAPQRKRRR